MGMIVTGAPGQDWGDPVRPRTNDPTHVPRRSHDRSVRMDRSIESQLAPDVETRPRELAAHLDLQLVLGRRTPTGLRNRLLGLRIEENAKSMDQYASPIDVERA